MKQLTIDEITNKFKIEHNIPLPQLGNKYHLMLGIRF